MQENIRNYKRLEQESDLIAKRVDDLTKINEVYSTWRENEDAILSQKYIYHRSDLQIKSKNLESSKEKVEAGNEDLGQYSLLIDKCETQIRE